MEEYSRPKTTILCSFALLEPHGEMGLIDRCLWWLGLLLYQKYSMSSGFVYFSLTREDNSQPGHWSCYIAFTQINRGIFPGLFTCISNWLDNCTLLNNSHVFVHSLCCKFLPKYLQHVCGCICVCSWSFANVLRHIYYRSLLTCFASLFKSVTATRQ